MTSKKVGILERLNNDEVIICDGGLTYCLERRGYVTAPIYTPEVVVEYPSAVREIHREFALCGADVLEAFVFNGTESSLNRTRTKDNKLSCKEINDAACQIVHEVADEYGCLVAGPISTTSAYTEKAGKDVVQKEVRFQVDIFKDKNVDFLIAEYIGTVEEAEWLVEVMKTSGLPVAITLCIGPLGDFNNVPVSECAVRLAKSGADIIGINCRFEPDTCIETVQAMRTANEKAGYKVHYMVQAVGYRTADVDNKKGFTSLDGCPLALESRLISRFDAYKYARKAYDAGIRFIGGCCGFQPYHIRAVAEELREERGGRLPINSRGIWGEHIALHVEEELRHKNKEFWYNLVPKDGRKSKEINNNDAQCTCKTI